MKLPPDTCNTRRPDSLGVITVDGIEIVLSSEKAICQASCYEVKLEKINKMIILFFLPLSFVKY